MNSMLTALADRRIFVVYYLVSRENGKTDKIPYNPLTGRNSDAQDPASWMLPHEAQAWATALGHPYGYGIVIHEGSGLFCVDIDGALVNGQWSPLAQAFCTRFAGCAIEVSVSGTGLHIFGSYAGPPPAHKSKNVQHHIEFYTEKRFIALTGTMLTGDVRHDATHLLPQFTADYFVPSSDAPGAPTEWTSQPVQEWNGPSDDAVLIERAMKSKSMAAVFGGKASFADLWNANADALGRTWPPNPTSGAAYDESSADLAMANHLAFWTGNDCERMLRLMCDSQLHRPKWEERGDYLPRTIIKACAQQRTWAGPTGAAKPVAMPLAPPPPALQTAPLETPAAPLPPGVPPIPLTMPTVDVPIGEGNTITSTGQVKLFDGCVYVQDMHQIMLPNGIPLDQKRFDVHFGHRIYLVTPDGQKPSDSAWNAFTNSLVASFPHVRGMYFDPREAAGTIMLREGQRYINSWLPVDIRKVDGDVTPFLRHLQILFPNDWRILLNYLKFMVQRKGEKSKWWPFLQGVPGNGKSFISDTMEYCLGLKYTQKPTPKNIDSQFNASLYGCLFIALEDVKVRDDYGAVWETLKPMVTGDRLEIQPKGVDKVTREVCFNGIMNSNHKIGIRKEPDDRRIASFFAAQQHRSDLARDGLTKPYFVALWTWAKADGWAHVAHYLETDPIDADAQFIESPVTSSTAEHIALSLPAAEQEVMENVTIGTPGFCGGWINSVRLDMVLASSGHARKVPRALRGELLESLGYSPHPGLPDGRVSGLMQDGTGSPRLYVTADHTTRGFMDAAQIRGAYESAQKPK